MIFHTRNSSYRVTPLANKQFQVEKIAEHSHSPAITLGEKIIADSVYVEPGFRAEFAGYRTSTVLRIEE
jgi:hypothetical protein